MLRAAHTLTLISMFRQGFEAAKYAGVLDVPQSRIDSAIIDLVESLKPNWHHVILEMEPSESVEGFVHCWVNLVDFTGEYTVMKMIFKATTLANLGQIQNVEYQ